MINNLKTYIKGKMKSFSNYGSSSNNQTNFNNNTINNNKNEQNINIDKNTKTSNYNSLLLIICPDSVEI